FYRNGRSGRVKLKCNQCSIDYQGLLAFPNSVYQQVICQTSGQLKCERLIIEQKNLRVPTKQFCLMNLKANFHFLKQKFANYRFSFLVLADLVHVRILKSLYN